MISVWFHEIALVPIYSFLSLVLFFPQGTCRFLFHKQLHKPIYLLSDSFTRRKFVFVFECLKDTVCLRKRSRGLSAKGVGWRRCSCEISWWLTLYALLPATCVPLVASNNFAHTHTHINTRERTWLCIGKCMPAETFQRTQTHPYICNYMCLNIVYIYTFVYVCSCNKCKRKLIFMFANS